MVETAASAHQPARPAEPGTLGLRIASALVLIPTALAATWFGSPFLPALVALVAGLMAWEWGRLVGRIRSWPDALLLGIPAALSVLTADWLPAASGFPLLSCIIALLGIWLQEALARGRNPAPIWTGLGLVWILGPSIGLIWLRNDPANGFATTAWLLAVVWAIDTAAFVVGRSVGGPKLLPRISPRKTWSGLLGGIAAAFLVGLAAGQLTGSPRWLDIAYVSAGLGIVEQIGDMVESYAKRRFGVKDSGSLIPGHGGLLDRLDGMLAVVTAIVILNGLTGGSVLAWR